MQERRVKHLVVVDKLGKLVGVVSRGDLLRVFLRPDGQIEQEILQDVLRRELSLNPSDFQVQVRDGEVSLGGHVDRRSIALMVVNAVQAVEGVTRLNSNLTWRLDDVEYRGSSPYAIPGP